MAYIDSYESQYSISQIRPIDVRIYYENKQPYIDYTGEAIGVDNHKWTIHIPKIGLSFDEFKCIRKKDYDPYCGMITNLSLNAFVVPMHDNDILFTITEREMTKEQIEKEIGCKVKIVEG